MWLDMVSARNRAGHDWLIDVDEIENPDDPGAENAVLALSAYNPTAIEEDEDGRYFEGAVDLYLTRAEVEHLIQLLVRFGNPDTNKGRRA